MRTTDKIAEYLSKESKGVINLSRQQAAAIIDIVTTGVYKKNMGGVAKLYRYNYVSNAWDMFRAVHTTDEEIKTQIIEALEKSPSKTDYMWECYNSRGEYEGRIYTLDVSLF